jgi:hypothetical protein
MKRLLETYLEYIQEDNITEQYDFGKVLKGDVRVSLIWSLGFLGLTAAWRAATMAFSQAHRKCGGLRGGPGKKACVAREQAKALQQKLRILNQAKSGCSKSKNPSECVNVTQVEIDKVNNKILLYKQRLQDVVGEQNQVHEQAAAVEVGRKVALGGLKVAGGLAGFARLMIVGMIVDKAIFMAWRTAAGLFSSSVRKCGTFKKGPEREICISKIKMNALGQKMSILRRVKSSCPKQRNPEKCNERVDKEIEKVARDIQWHRDNIVGQNKQKGDEEKVGD